LVLGSAGKFITHIAALQCVERGLIGLDDPVYLHLPELRDLEVISRNDGPEALRRPFLLRPASKQITLYHLLTHSSGIDHENNPILKEWRVFKQSESPDWDGPSPLLFEPGEGWIYEPVWTGPPVWFIR
jgi:CubicO group peptidase (beta-lactamase class C family)